MNKLTKLTSGALVAGVTLAMLATTSFAADNTITGNGVKSVNTISVSNTCTSSVTQTNNTTVNAGIDASASTGGNNVSGNTGSGDITVGSGDATTTVGVVVTGGDNTSLTPSCCCNQVTAGDPAITGNGKKSVNTIVVSTSSTQSTTQTGSTTVNLGVKAKSKTGKNKVKNNTSSNSGSVDLTSGDSSTTVGLQVTGGGNSN